MSLLVLIGKTCSGKDTVQNILIKKYGYDKLVTYTTRPMREGEIQNDTYHFISKDEFEAKIKSNFFLEYRKYYTSNGIWYYGSAKEDYIKDENLVIILTPEGVKAIISKGITLTVIYLHTDEDVIKKRLINRGDNKDEAKRRIEADNKDFNSISDLKYSIVSNNGDRSLEEVAYEINNLIGGDLNT